MRSALISRCPEGLTIPHDGCVPEGWPLVEQALLSIAGDADMTPALKARLLDLARGSSYSQIAHAYGISINTVKTQVSHVLASLGVHCCHEIRDAAEAAQYHARAGAAAHEIKSYLRTRFE